MRMTVHNRAEWFYGEKIGNVAKELYEAGYAFDYVSPRMVKAGLAKKYAAVVDPETWSVPHAEARNRPLRVGATHGEATKPSGARAEGSVVSAKESGVRG